VKNRTKFKSLWEWWTCMVIVSKRSAWI